MPSRVKLKMKIVSLEAEKRALEKALDRAWGAESVFKQELKRKDQEYIALMTQWQKFQKEYDRLCAEWNAFQGMVHRPTSEDMIRKRAQGEMVQAISQMLVRAIFPNGAAAPGEHIPARYRDE